MQVGPGEAAAQTSQTILQEVAFSTHRYGSTATAFNKATGSREGYCKPQFVKFLATDFRRLTALYPVGKRSLLLQQEAVMAGLVIHIPTGLVC